MYEVISDLLSDKRSGTFTFKPFSPCHIIYLLLIGGAIALTIYLSRNKDQETKKKIIEVTTITALCLYIMDFFIMPFSQGEISIDKLPFHVCTLMGIMCVLARRTKTFAKFKTAFTLIGLAGGLAYMVYPVGVPIADGYSYRIIQTVIYHGLMIAQGVFAIAFKDIDLRWKSYKYDVMAIFFVLLWAMLGNTLYSGTVKEVCGCYIGCVKMVPVYTNEFNWFFTKHDVLYIINDSIDIYIAPIIMFVAFSGLVALVRLVGLALLNEFDKNAESYTNAYYIAEQSKICRAG